MKISTAAVSLILGLTAMCLYMSNGRYIGTSDTMPALLLPLSLIDERNLDFNEFSDVQKAQPYWFVVKKERVVSYYPVMPGILNTITHLVSRQLGLNCKAPCVPTAKFTAAAATAASVSLLFLTLIKLCRHPHTAIVVTLIYAFCTCVWSVAAQGLWQHGPSLLFLTAALACLVRPERRWLFALSGFFLGLAVFNRPTNILLAIPATVFVLWSRPRQLGGFLAAAALPAIFMAWYSWAYWGSLLALGQGQGVMAGTPGAHANHFNYPILKGMAGVLLSPGRGLFVFSPIFLFAVPFLFYALWPWARVKPIYRFLAVAAIAILLLYSRWSMWWGGWSFGYRLLIEVTPFLAVFLAKTYEHWIAPHRRLQLLFYSTAVISFYIHFLGATFYPTDWNRRVDVDRHPERNWDWHDSELNALQKDFTQLLTKK